MVGMPAFYTLPPSESRRYSAMNSTPSETCRQSAEPPLAALRRCCDPSVAAPRLRGGGASAPGCSSLVLLSAPASCGLSGPYFGSGGELGALRLRGFGGRMFGLSSRAAVQRFAMRRPSVRLSVCPAVRDFGTSSPSSQRSCSLFRSRGSNSSISPCRRASASCSPCGSSGR